MKDLSLDSRDFLLLIFFSYKKKRAQKTNKANNLKKDRQAIIMYPLT